jgi:hypothetical protein
MLRTSPRYNTRHVLSFPYSTEGHHHMPESSTQSENETLINDFRALLQNGVGS